MESTMTRKTNIPRIERGMTKLVVPHEKGNIVFAHPSHGPDTYRNVGAQILESGQNAPTGDYAASLVHAAYCVLEVENEPEFKNVREIMRNRWLWVFNRNLWTSEGVYVLQDLEALGRSQPLNQNDLEKRLKGGKELTWVGIRFSKDGRARFAPKGSYQLGDHTPESLAKDGFVVAGYGSEGAEKLGEVSTKFRYSPRILGVNIEEGQNPEQRVSALGGDSGDWLYVPGDDWYDHRGDCHAFGVLKDAEGIAPKK